MSTLRFSLAIPHWRKLYENAILEGEITKIPERVEEAKKAIQSTVVELSSQGKNDDCRRLLDCLHVLDGLLKMHERAQGTEQ